MWIGNLMLLVLNLPLIGLWTRMLTLPYYLMFPCIVITCCIGSFNVSNNPFDVYMLAVFGVIGYIFVKLDCEPAPFLLGFVLGPMLEDHFRRAMMISRGSPMIFLTHPISAVLLGIAALTLLAVLLPTVSKFRGEAFKE
jgi:TctA family transporter